MDSTNRSKFVYLVQGRKDLTIEFLSLVGNIPNVIVATWDEPLSATDSFALNTFFIPNTTWAEGRNFLYQIGIEMFPDATYFVFCDEDVRFREGFLEDFELEILDRSPGIAFPLCDRIKNEGWYSDKLTERPIRHDQVFQVFHRRVLEERIVFPLDTKFDEISWWLTTNLQHYLIQTKYFNESLQFNDYNVYNTHHTLENEQISTEENVSKYLNGEFTSDDLTELKKYIDFKFGKQKRILDTIYQRSIHNRLRIKNLNKKHWRYFMELLLIGDFIQSIKLFIKIVFTFVSNVIYPIFWPSSTLLGSSRVAARRHRRKRR